MRESLSIGNPFSFVIRSRQTLQDRPTVERRILLKRCYKAVGSRWRHRRRESSGCTRDGNLSTTGPTGCGKTYFAKMLLQSCRTKMAPPPQRIVWLYKRWQPLYGEISRTVVPQVEFVRGIPYDLDGNHYFDPRIRNVIVLDDLMSTTAKDPRINDLFTEGSYHRNLSVVTLNQNLFFGKDLTQRRNCHYLVFFNNPVDRQPVTTLEKEFLITKV